MDKKKKVWLLSIGFLLFLLLDALLIGIESRNYQEKMDLMYQTVGKSGTGDSIDWAAETLKGRMDQKAAAQGRLLLEEYGYESKGSNVYRKRLYTDSLKITVLLLALYGFGALVCLYLERNMRKRQERGVKELKEQLSCLRDGLAVRGGGNALSHELESLSDALKTMRERAAIEKEETKSLVTDLSHQLKTPVAALKTSFEILESQKLTREERLEFESRCREQLLRLEELVGALVDISRMETGMIVIHREQEPVFETLLLAVNRIYPKACEKEIEIVFEAEDELQTIRIPHDRKWLSEAIINVLENAVKYSPPQTQIVIRMQKLNFFLRIEVEDEGPGIPKAEWNLIFQRFYRGREDWVQAQQGSGVGLYLARQILKLHQGTLSIASAGKHTVGKQGKGSRFVFQIPYQ